MAKAFSIEDGNLSNVPITSSVERTYVDIDCSFEMKPTGDIYKKTDAAAVKQAVKNLLMTPKGSAPFSPFYGGGLDDLLFELTSDLTQKEIEDQVAETIGRYEPRARVTAVKAILVPDYNSIDITVLFQVISTLEEVTLNVTIGRTR